MTTKADIITIFNLLEQEPSVNNFSDRKKLQKLVYLSEVFGIDLGFSFTWYIYGPYSSRVTRIMFDKEKGNSIRVKEIPNIEKKISKLKTFLKEDINSSDRLELLSSIHYIASLVKDPEKSKSEILNTIYEVKPDFSKEEVLECYNRVLQLFKK